MVILPLDWPIFCILIHTISVEVQSIALTNCDYRGIHKLNTVQPLPTWGKKNARCIPTRREEGYLIQIPTTQWIVEIDKLIDF